MNRNRILLVALPFAGGNCYSYNFLKALLPPQVLLETLEYPGRGKRAGEPLVYAMEPLVADLMDQYRSLIARVHPVKVVLYGHSIGSVTGFAFLHALSEYAPDKMPGLAIFSGHGSPMHTAKKKLATLPEQELISYFKSIGSLSPQIASDTELMDYILPILRNDLAVYEGYATQYTSRLSIPIVVMNGKEDNLRHEDISNWALVTTSATAFYDLEGHHFFITQNPAAFSGLLTHVIDKHFPGIIRAQYHAGV